MKYTIFQLFSTNLLTSPPITATVVLQANKEKQMNVKAFNQTEGTATVEVWNTRFGTSVRVVKRSKGQFKNNKSAKQLLKV
jgi:hypothetical protein